MDKQETKICPNCGKEILAVAKKCKYCKQFIDTESELSSQEPMQTEITEEPELKKELSDNESNKKEFSGKFCQRCGAQVIQGTSICEKCGAYIPQYIIKSERNKIESKITSIKSSEIFCQILEFIGISATIYYIFAGGAIVDITYGVCSGILAIYFRIKRIHNSIEIQNLRKELGL